jgi:hypothetical protein
MKPYFEKTHHRKRAGGVAQGEGFEFKPQYCKTNKQTKPLFSKSHCEEYGKVTPH